MTAEKENTMPETEIAADGTFQVDAQDVVAHLSGEVARQAVEIATLKARIGQDAATIQAFANGERVEPEKKRTR